MDLGCRVHCHPAHPSPSKHVEAEHLGHGRTCLPSDKHTHWRHHCRNVLPTPQLLWVLFSTRLHHATNTKPLGTCVPALSGPSVTTKVHLPPSMRTVISVVPSLMQLRHAWTFVGTILPEQSCSSDRDMAPQVRKKFGVR